MGKVAFDSLGSQWRVAAQELGVEIVAPYTLNTPEGDRFEFSCWLPQFGSERGMLLCATYNKVACDAATKLGFGFSCLDPDDPAASMDISGYVDCLKDWGWAANGTPPPSWYTEGGNAI